MQRSKCSPRSPKPTGMCHAPATLHHHGAVGRVLPRAQDRTTMPTRSTGTPTSASTGSSSHGSSSRATGLGEEDIVQPPPGSAWHPGPRQAAVATRGLARGGRGQEGLATASPASADTALTQSRRLTRAGADMALSPISCAGDTPGSCRAAARQCRGGPAVPREPRGAEGP